MSDKPILPASEAMVDLEFVISDLYDHLDDVAGSESSVTLEGWSEFGKEQKGVSAKGTRVDKLGRPIKK